MSLAQAAAKKLLWTLVSLAVVTLVFAAIEFTRHERERVQQQLEALARSDTTLATAASEEAARVAARVQALRAAPGRLLQERIDTIGRELRQHAGQAPLRSLPPHELALLALRGDLAGRVRAELQVELWTQEQAYLMKLLQVADYQAAVAQARQLERERDEALRTRRTEEARLKLAQGRVNALERAMGSVYRTPDVKDADAALQRVQEATRRHAELSQRAARASAALGTHPGREDPGAFTPSVEGVRAATRQALAAAEAATQARIEADWLHRVTATWAPFARAAAQVIASGIAVLVLWKLMFFFVLAPWLARRPPTRIEPGAGDGEPPPALETSAVSLRVTLASGQEMLVRDAYLQDTPVGARANTRVLLSRSYPLASVASGMFGLTRIAPPRDAPAAAVTVSSIVNPLDELARIPLSRSTGFVLLPRYLVALVQDTQQPIAIRSVWRLGSLHAWLTGQLRYLVFHGPGTVVVRGCRGVRIERPDAQRRIAQAATIGFSARLDYASGRTETFLPYLLGQKPLFHDSFSGEGFYAYQEVPAGAGQPGSAEGRLMGIFDALLKPFGI